MANGINILGMQTIKFSCYYFLFTKDDYTHVNYVVHKSR